MNEKMNVRVPLKSFGITQLKKIGQPILKVQNIIVKISYIILDFPLDFAIYEVLLI